MRGPGSRVPRTGWLLGIWSLATVQDKVLSAPGRSPGKDPGGRLAPQEEGPGERGAWLCPEGERLEARGDPWRTLGPTVWVPQSPNPSPGRAPSETHTPSSAATDQLHAELSCPPGLREMGMCMHSFIHSFSQPASRDRSPVPRPGEG